VEAVRGLNAGEPRGTARHTDDGEGCGSKGKARRYRGRHGVSIRSNWTRMTPVHRIDIGGPLGGDGGGSEAYDHGLALADGEEAELSSVRRSDSAWEPTRSSQPTGAA
jgi:hypothetical protein